MIQYGLISKVDSSVLEKTIDLIKEGGNWFINILEVGIYGGETGNGLREYAKSKGLEVCLTGIDNNKDGEKLRHEYTQLIIGNSNEVYNQIEDESQHLIFIDALHTFPSVVADFYCYADKVKPGGFLCFHDTAIHLNGLSQWQRVGDKNDSDMCLGGVRKALTTVGLLNNMFPEWGLIYDEADVNDTGGGVCVFKKLY